MQTLFRRFCDQDHGGVTVDWMFLTGGLLSLAIAVLATISTGSSDFADETSDAISAVEVDAG